MTNSNIKPDPIRVDIIRNGAARLDCAWDITTSKTEEGDTTYNYNHGVIWWALPDPAYIKDRKTLTKSGQIYLNEHTEEILGWVKAKELKT